LQWKRGGSNYWGRELQALGYKVLLIPPIHVKPFVKGNKNDRNDSFAITEAARRPHLQSVMPRTLEQTDIMQVHKLRARQVDSRTALINQMRGFLSEYGEVVAQGKEKLLAALPELLENANNNLTRSARELIQQAWREWRSLNERIASLDNKLKLLAKNSEPATRLMQIKGVAEKTATAVIAHAGNGAVYKNGRHFSANLGLVPKENSSGGKQKLGGITKRGNKYIRRLLVQGAWSVLRNAEGSNDRLSKWALEVASRRGKQKSVVAVANKMARIIWAMLFHQTEYRSN
jgi:transposase